MKTDLQLQADVVNELKWEPSVNAANISIEVQQGEVTLAGYVDTYAEKSRAEEAAQRVYGVKSVEAALDVRLLSSAERPDDDVAKAAENVLRWSNDLHNNSVKVMVKNDWITLTGFVEWAFQKHNLGYAVSNLMGVMGISNQLSIEPRVKVVPLIADIEQVLQRRDTPSLRHVVIDVRGSEVVLSGVVESWVTREVVHYSSWNTPGVHCVINQIKIA